MNDKYLIVHFKVNANRYLICKSINQFNHQFSVYQLKIKGR